MVSQAFASHEKILNVDELGMPVSSEEVPALWELAHEVSAAAGCDAPDSLLLTPDMNAHAIELGGWFRKNKRVLAIGVGLFSYLPRSALKAVMAHEMGHLALGHVRSSGERLKEQLLAQWWMQSQGTLLQSRVDAMVGPALKQAHAHSREREFAADEFALTAVGPDALIQGLVRVGLGTALFYSFMQSEVFPLVLVGGRPRELFLGFRAYVEGIGASGRGQEVVDGLKQASSEVFDTHPALMERLAAVRGDVMVSETMSSPFRDDIANIDVIERRLSVFWAESTGVAGLPEIAWDDVDLSLFVPNLLNVAEQAAHLVAASLELPKRSNLDDVLRTLLDALDARGRSALAQRLAPSQSRDEVSAAEVIAGAVAALLYGVLLNRGGVVEHRLGGPMNIRLGSMSYDPYALGMTTAAKGAADLRATLAHLDAPAP